MDLAITITVNGQRHAITTPSDRPLLDVLREDLRLTGPKFGCGQGQCGACSVLVDGKRAFSCITRIGDADQKAITTVEGLSGGEALHPVQQAFLEEGAYQCGYCTGGMIMAATALLAEKPKPTDEEIVAWMNTNLCRCCGYTKIMHAVRRAAGR